MKQILPILSIILLTTSFSPVSAQSNASLRTLDPVLRFFPNPATAFVTFDFQRGFDRGYSIHVYSFLGKMVYEAKNITQRTTINLTDFTRGMYIYQLRDQSGKLIESGKFQVSK